ncbi:MAG: hypothetical protein QF464_09415, partial [Myxococcota bacterium]|nr:hypothetical protein [Myxococcota bacterium]
MVRSGVMFLDRVPITALLLCAACGHADTGETTEPVEDAAPAVTDAGKEDRDRTSPDVQSDARDAEPMAEDTPPADTGVQDASEPTDSQDVEVPPIAACGDGVLDPGEACDDGEDNGAYGHCAEDCGALGPHCGDGQVDGFFGEVCDDGTNDALGGGCLPGCAKEDISDEVFAEGLVTVDITMDPADWEAMRHQRKTRHGMFGTADCRNEQIENPYTWFDGQVSINGTLITHTGLRKKGHIGSQSTRK